MSNERSVTSGTIFLITLVLVVFLITSTAMTAKYASAQNNSGSNMSSTSVTNATSSTALDLNQTMAELESSNDPTDIATLAYIYGFPLVSVVRLVDYDSSPNVPPGPGRGPINTFSSFPNFPTPNLRTLLVLMLTHCILLDYWIWRKNLSFFKSPQYLEGIIPCSL